MTGHAVWLVVPLGLALLVTGLGLLAARLARLPLPAPVVPVVGLAALIAVAGLLTVSPWTARAAVPVVAALALVGLGLAAVGADRPGLARAGRTAALGTVAYAVAAGPPLLTTQAGPPGHVRLDDTVTWVLTAGHVLERGRDLSGLDPSTPTSVLQTWLGGGYPVGSFLPFGVAGRLTGTDLALAYGPVLAVTAALVALGLAAAARTYVGGPWRAALAGLVAAQASLLVAYTDWGGMKEVVTAALLTAAAVLAVTAGRDPRALALLALVAGTLLQVLGPQGAVWAAPALLAGVVAAGVGAARRLPEGLALQDLRARGRHALRPVGVSAAVLAVTLVPVVGVLGFARFARPGAVQATDTELGNLAAPVPLLHALGLWPGADPLSPAGDTGSAVVAVLCLLAALAALVLSVLARRPDLPVLAAVVVTGAVPAVLLGSPWVDAKVLAIVAPVVLLGAVAFSLGWVDSPAVPARAGAAALTALLVVATAGSTLTIARAVTAGPHDRLADLAVVGSLVAGRGPTLVLDPDVYATRWHLRDGDTDGISDLRPDLVPRRDGTSAPSLSTVDVGEVEPGVLHAYRSLVRRWSPAASRPPAAYSLVGRVGEWEVWTRDLTRQRAAVDLPLGTGGADPTAVPDCTAVRALAAAGSTLTAVRRTPPVVVAVDPAGAPPPWRAGGLVVPSVDGSLEVTASVPRGGRWRVWVGGGTAGRLSVSVDGRPVGSRTHVVAHGAPWLRLDALDLDEGEHRVRLAYDDRGGIGGGLPVPVGPVALTPVDEEGELPVLTLRADEVCDGSAYDWVAVS